MKKFSVAWKSSKKSKKQRKYRYNAPLHLRNKFMSVHLSKELRLKHKRRNISVRKEDTVKVLRGQFSGKSGKVERIDIKKVKVYVTGIDMVKKDGTKSFLPIDPSNLVITNLVLNDKKRAKSLERK